MEKAQSRRLAVLIIGVVGALAITAGISYAFRVRMVSMDSFAPADTYEARVHDAR